MAKLLLVGCGKMGGALLAEWLAKGSRQDARASRQVRVVAALIVAGLVTWAVLTLG